MLSELNPMPSCTRTIPRPRPRPDIWPRVLVLVIVLVAVLAGVRAGYPAPDVVTLIGGAGLAAAQLARDLFTVPALPAPDGA